MYVEHHSLINDFPEFRDELHALRSSDLHFARMAETYEQLDKQICRIESGAEVMGDDALSTLKQERVGLKDNLLRQLKRAAGRCCGCGNNCSG